MAGLYSHRLIYSPRMIIFKHDNRMYLSRPYYPSIVTFAASNANLVHDQTILRNTFKEFYWHSKSE